MNSFVLWILLTFGPPLLREILKLAAPIVAELERTDLTGPAKRDAAIAKLKQMVGEAPMRLLNLAVEIAVSALKGKA